jgi:hypothetical protein
LSALLRMVRFVTVKKFCELTGYTAAGVYSRKCKGAWPEGSVWRYEPGTTKILMDLEAFERWVEAGEPPVFPRVGGSHGSPKPPQLEPPERRGKSPLRPELEPPEPRARRAKKGEAGS